MKPLRVRRDSSGFTMLEVLVSIFIVTIAILGLTSAGELAGRQLQRGGADSSAAMAIHYQIEALKAQGFDSISAGGDTVMGHAMTWDVKGINPKRIILVVELDNGSTAATRDTIVTHLADPTP